MGQGRMENPYQKANTLNLIDARRIQVMDTKVLRCWVFCQKVVPTSLIFLSWWPLFLWLVSLTWGRRGDSGPLFLRLADHSLETWAGGFPLKHVTSRKLAHLASVRIFFICIVRIIIFVNQDVIYLQWSFFKRPAKCAADNPTTLSDYTKLRPPFGTLQHIPSSGSNKFWRRKGRKSLGLPSAICPSYPFHVFPPYFLHSPETNIKHLPLK